MVTLSFSQEDLMILDQALQQMPYGRVVTLISKINEQIDGQGQTGESEDKPNVDE